MPVLCDEVSGSAPGLAVKRGPMVKGSVEMEEARC